MSKEELCIIQDVTEGLENRIKAFSKDNHTIDQLVEKVSTKRYTKTRVQRIITANLLGIKEQLVKDALEEKLYAKILAVNANAKEIIPLVCSKSSIPVLTRKSDATQLKKTAEKVFEKDVLANDLHALITGNKTNENQMLIV